MSVITAAVPSVLVAAPAAPLSDGLWHLSVDQYHRMADAGILDSDARVELLEGLLVEKMSKNPDHRLATGLVRTTLEHLMPPGWFVDVTSL